jgi:hypothetical protein
MLKKIAIPALALSLILGGGFSRSLRAENPTESVTKNEKSTKPHQGKRVQPEMVGDAWNKKSTNSRPINQPYFESAGTHKIRNQY